MVEFLPLPKEKSMAFFDLGTRINEKEILNLIRHHSYSPHEGLEPLYERIGDAKIVLLGEASHGTHEYYLWRARITRHLVEKMGFTIIGVEGDWPDCYRINRYVRDYENSGDNAIEVLKNFNRWPTWMWSNYEISALMEWLKNFNKTKPYNQQAGFYGLDVYSLWESLEAIRGYLQKNDPDALATAEKALKCFEPYDMEGTEYASAIRFVPESCEKEVLELLQKIRSRITMYDSDPEAPFNAEQNARTAVNAEKYYRAMIGGGGDSWNIRDTHMTDTLENLLYHHGEEAKAIVWEHNTHIGDARATDMGRGGMVNVGQLSRERWGKNETVSVGFGSNRGSVIAADAWGEEMEEMEVPDARENSWESILHKAEQKDRLIITRDIAGDPAFSKKIQHRAIGVVYHPGNEYYGNYVPSNIPDRYDAFLFIDKTKALHPLGPEKERRLMPETYPWGI